MPVMMHILFFVALIFECKGLPTAQREPKRYAHTPEEECLKYSSFEAVQNNSDLFINESRTFYNDDWNINEVLAITPTILGQKKHFWHTAYDLTSEDGVTVIDEIEWMVRELGNVDATKHVFEWGFGVGGLVAYMANTTGFASYKGINIAEKQIEKAREIVGKEIADDNEYKEKIEFFTYDGRTLPFEDAQFDVVLCQESMSYCPNFPEMYREFWRVLKPGGKIVMQDWFACNNLTEEEYCDFVVPFNELFSCYLFPVDDHEALLRQIGFVDVKQHDVYEAEGSTWPKTVANVADIMQQRPEDYPDGIVLREDWMTIPERTYLWGNEHACKAIVTRRICVSMLTAIKPLPRKHPEL